MIMYQRTLDLIKANVSDPEVYNTIYKEARSKARETAIVLGFLFMVAFIAVVYAYVQQTVAKAETRFAKLYESKLEICITKTQKQQALAVEAQLIAEEANRQSAKLLKECQGKK